MSSRALALCYVCLAFLPLPRQGNTALAEDWPNFRGPAHNGISAERGWLDHWPDQGPPVLWKASVGLGFSSCAVAQNRLFTTGNAENTDTIFCFDAVTGKELWKHSFPADLGDKYFEGGTTGTPTADGQRVYLLSRWGDVFCFDAVNGNVVWNRNLQKDMGVRVPTWGFSGSPTVVEDLLILSAGEAGLALEKATGKTVWHSSNKDAGYSTPVPVTQAGQTSALVSSTQAYIAIDARTGREQWRMRWLTEYGVNASDPVVSDDRVFISSGYGKGAALLQVSPAAEPRVLWKSKVLRTQRNGSILLDGYLYGVDGDSTDQATLKCVELATGTEKWSEPAVGSGAFMVADHKLLVLSDHGELMVAAATPEGFHPTARAQVLGGKCWTVPVLANGLVYCRNSRGDLVCVDLRTKSGIK